MRRFLVVAVLAAAFLVPSAARSGPVCDMVNDGDYTSCYWDADNYGTSVSVPIANINVGVHQADIGSGDHTEVLVCHPDLDCTRLWIIGQNCYALIVLGTQYDCSAVVLPAPLPYLGPYIP